VQAVATKAEAVAEQLQLPPDVLVSAAWLHDIGYAGEVAASGFHPLDGARYLRGLHVDKRVIALVAHHSCAVLEADVRGLDSDLLAEFDSEPGVLAEALAYCDMTTGPDGESLDVGDRLAEIRSRYGKDHPVTQFIDNAEAMIRSVVVRTENRMQQASR
jgi:putative nucleotidyltransferase with HDIG domain